MSVIVRRYIPRVFKMPTLKPMKNYTIYIFKPESLSAA